MNPKCDRFRTPHQWQDKSAYTIIKFFSWFVTCDEVHFLDIFFYEGYMISFLQHQEICLNNSMSCICQKPTWFMFPLIAAVWISSGPHNSDKHVARQIIFWFKSQILNESIFSMISVKFIWFMIPSLWLLAPSGGNIEHRCPLSRISNQIWRTWNDSLGCLGRKIKSNSPNSRKILWWAALKSETFYSHDSTSS